MNYTEYSKTLEIARKIHLAFRSLDRAASFVYMVVDLKEER